MMKLTHTHYSHLLRLWNVSLMAKTLLILWLFLESLLGTLDINLTSLISRGKQRPSAPWRQRARYGFILGRPCPPFHKRSLEPPLSRSHHGVRMVPERGRFQGWVVKVYVGADGPLSLSRSSRPGHHTCWSPAQRWTAVAPLAPKGSQSGL